jgi:hypothetical protein
VLLAFRILIQDLEAKIEFVGIELHRVEGVGDRTAGGEGQSRGRFDTLPARRSVCLRETVEHPLA